MVHAIFWRNLLYISLYVFFNLVDLTYLNVLFKINAAKTGSYHTSCYYSNDLYIDLINTAQKLQKQQNKTPVNVKFVIACNTCISSSGLCSKEKQNKNKYYWLKESAVPIKRKTYHLAWHDHFFREQKLVVERYEPFLKYKIQRYFNIYFIVCDFFQSL